MIITRVFASGFEEQERREKIRARKLQTAKSLVIPREDEGALARRSKSMDLVFAAGRGSSCIGNFPEDGRMLRSRRRGHVRRPSIPGLVCQQGKGRRFLGSRRKSELIRESNR